MRLKTHFIITINLLFLAVLFGCTNDSDNMIIDLDREDNVSVYDIFSEVNIVIPETKEGYLISTIDKVEYFDGKYYIFDIKSQQIFCVDETGKFHFKISSTGSGPGEYIYIGHMSIDRYNEQILLLEPSMQRIQIFDLNGQYLETVRINDEEILAYNWVYALNENTIVLISVIGDQLIFYCKNKKEIIERIFPSPVSQKGVYAFTPSFRNLYQIEDKSFFNPVLNQQVYDITTMSPIQYHEWDFGENNNSEKAYQSVINKLNNYKGDQKLSQRDFVGRGKLLNQNIVKISETSRYLMAVIEYNNDFKNVVIDKKEGKSYVFRAFREGVSLVLLNIINNKAMASAAEYEYVSSAIREQRILSSFDPSVLKKDDLNKLESWDELKDNMFFVVYKFRE